ncbi:response regulator [Altererythrobacter sp. BO-6]|uniref:response regulator n=1 Tax=Altererythrobacter sp. BO-6 TaxID=2604537 RepID=UPI001F494DA8
MAGARGESAETPVRAEQLLDHLDNEAEFVADGEAAFDTDAIVRAAKAMRDVNETRAARQRTCLVVDDSRVIRKVASKIAANLGYRVIEAENGHEGLAWCKRAMPDLVLTDWQMPEMDGIAFVTELRAIPTPRAPTVVFCTSKGDISDIHEGIAAGADDYVIKPFDEAALSAKLEKLGVR